MICLRNITGGIAALALAVSAFAFSARPAQAIDADDLFRFLLGAATVAIIQRAAGERQPPTERRYTGWTLPGHCIETMRSRGRTVDVYNAGCLRSAGLRNLPNRCERSVRTDRGPRSVFSQQCLFNAGYRTEQAGPPQWQTPPPWGATPPRVSPRPTRMTLPASCSLNYRVEGRAIAGFYGDCLARAGFNRLPQQCALTARLGGQRHSIYNASCLQNHGYRRG